jgi:hypothetical protein
VDDDNLAGGGVVPRGLIFSLGRFTTASSSELICPGSSTMGAIIPSSFHAFGDSMPFSCQRSLNPKEISYVYGAGTFHGEP